MIYIIFMFVFMSIIAVAFRYDKVGVSSDGFLMRSCLKYICF